MPAASPVSSGDHAPVVRDDVARYNPGDRWAHRRLEPRGLAIIWSAFLFFLTITIFAGAPALQSGGGDHARHNARLVLIALTAGVVVLWPMLRLSQATPIRGFAGGGGRDAGMLGDLFVILAPAQAIIWPQATRLLAGWPREVVACASAWIAAWAFLIGGLLALALRPRSVEDLRRHRPDDRPRWAWMLVILLLVMGGLALVPLSRDQPGSDGSMQGRSFHAAWMASPFTGLSEITRDRSWSGQAARVTPQHWRSAGVVALVAVPIWIVAIWRAGRARPSA